MYNTRITNIFYKVIIIIITPSILFSDSFKYYQIEYKDNKKEISKVVSLTDQYTYIFKNNIINKIDNKLIKTYTLINKNDQKFKRVILLTEKNYIHGYIVYQDREKLSLSLNIDDPSLMTIKFDNIIDIVNSDTFDYEMSKTKWQSLKYSFFFPGLGQFYTSDRNFSGIFFMSSFLLSSAWSFYMYRQSKVYYSQYRESGYKEKKYYNKYKNYTYSFYTFISLSSIIFMINLMDSYYNFKCKYDIKNEKKVSMDINYKDNISISISKRF